MARHQEVFKRFPLKSGSAEVQKVELEAISESADGFSDQKEIKTKIADIPHKKHCEYGAPQNLTKLLSIELTERWFT